MQYIYFIKYIFDSICMAGGGEGGAGSLKTEDPG